MAPRLKPLIHEIHRRSLWQVTTVYVGTSWFVLEVTDQVIERFLLPEWVYGGAIILLLIGLPIVLATAFVREEAPGAERHAPGTAPPMARGVEPDEPPSVSAPGLRFRLFTWPKAIVGGLLAFTALGLISALMVLRGAARVNAPVILALARHIFEHGTEGRFYSQIRKYHHEGGKVYWSMDPTPEATTLINRCDEEQTYEARLASGTLPKRRQVSRQSDP